MSSSGSFDNRSPKAWGRNIEWACMLLEYSGRSTNCQNIGGTQCLSERVLGAVKSSVGNTEILLLYASFLQPER